MGKENLTVKLGLLPVTKPHRLQTFLQGADHKSSALKVQGYHKMIPHCFGV